MGTEDQKEDFEKKRSLSRWVKRDRSVEREKRGLYRYPRKSTRKSGEEDRLVLVLKAEGIHICLGSTRDKLLLAWLTPASARVSAIACAAHGAVMMHKLAGVAP